MSLIPYALARRFLFGLDPETAHELTMASLARTQGTPLPTHGTRVVTATPVSPVRRSTAAIEKVALASEAYLKQTGGAKPKKVIVVPGRLVNVVVAP